MADAKDKEGNILHLDPEDKPYSLANTLMEAALGMMPVAPRMSDNSMMNTTFGGYTKGYAHGAYKNSLSFRALRDIAWRSPLLSAIIATRQHQVGRFCMPEFKQPKFSVGFKISHKLEHDKDFEVPDNFKFLCREVTEMLEKPWRVWMGDNFYRNIEPTFYGFLISFVEDLLVLNRGAVELGTGGDKIPRAFGVIDGANIIPTFAAVKFFMTQDHEGREKPDLASWPVYRNMLQRYADKYKINLTEETEWIYLLDGRPVETFRGHELMVCQYQRQSDIKTQGYPRSMVEKAIYIILSEIMAMSANSRYFESGSMAEMLLTVKGNNDDPHVKKLEEILKANLSGIRGMFRVPLVGVPGGSDDIGVVNFKQNHKDMLFDVYIQKLTNLCCAVFRMHPSEINEAPRAGDNSGGLSQASQTEQIAHATEEGLESMLTYLKVDFFDPLVERIDPNLMFEWVFGRNEEEMLKVNQLYAPITTVNERRLMAGMDALPDEKGGDVVDNQFIMQREQMNNQNKQMEAQGAQGAPGEAEQGGEGQEAAPEEKPPQKAPKKAQGATAKLKEKQPEKKGGYLSKTPWSDEDEKFLQKMTRQ